MVIHISNNIAQQNTNKEKIEKNYFEQKESLQQDCFEI